MAYTTFLEEQKMKHKYAKLVGLLLVAVMLGGLLAACSPAPVNKILCPLNYDLVGGEDCKSATSNPDPVKYQLLDAVLLNQGWVGFYTQPGDRGVLKLDTIGYNSAPAIYTKVYPTLKQTYRTVSSFDACTQFEKDYKLCATPLDNIRLRGAVGATVNFELDFKVLGDVKENAIAFAGFEEGYLGLIKALDGYMRSSAFRNANDIDASSYADGTMDQKLIDLFSTRLKKWQYASLVEFGDMRLRGLSVEGYNGSSVDLQSQQGVAAAKAYATMEATACNQYSQEAFRSYCMAVFIWSRKTDGSPMPVAPVGYPVPSAAVVITPIP